MKSHDSALQRMVDRWVVRGGTPRQEWEADALSYINDLKGVRAVEWVDDIARVIKLIDEFWFSIVKLPSA